MKQTAVQWLQQSLSLTFEQQMQFEGLFQQAKEMEKQQKGYSEEDMKIAFDANIKDWICFDEFIEQFKNK